MTHENVGQFPYKINNVWLRSSLYHCLLDIIMLKVEQNYPSILDLTFLKHFGS